MKEGLRQHKSAECRVSIAYGLPDEMHEATREIVAVKAGNARKGHATALMHTVCAEADREWITLIVNVKQFDEGMDDEKLKRWYSRFGFIEIQQEPCVLMVRSPEPARIAGMH